MNDKNIRMTRGDTLAFGMEFDGLGQDLDSAYFTCKKAYEGENIFQRSLGNGISKVEDGIYRVRIAPSDTKNIDAGKYYYDLEIGVNGDIFTIMKGILDIEPDVTQEV